MFCAQVQANVITGVAAIPSGYYDGVNGKKGADNILNALNGIIKSHTVLNYNALEDYYERTDFYGDTLWDMYSTCRFTMDEANKSQKAVCDGWNKEHLVCQSWFSGDGMKSDLFNVYPTDARVNNIRSNYAYGEVSGSWGTGISNNLGHALGKKGTNTFPGYSGTVFEPHDDYKGDFARSFMYMATCYRTGSLNGGDGAAMFTSSPTNLTTYAKNLLLKWHRNDPVSEKEIDRNQAVYGEQHNRNPFIDYPDLAEYIWGDRVGQTVNLASMIPTCDTYQHAQQTKYGVTWMVNGQVLKVDSVSENKKPNALPEAPQSCSETSESFYGWAGGSWDGVLPDYLPADIIEFSNIAYMPPVDYDVTYHAVFAHAEQEQGSGPVTATQDFSNYSRGNAVTTVNAGNVTITFDKANASNAATYYTEVRCYGGSTIAFSGATMSKIEFGAGTNDKGNALTPNTGTMTTSAIWEGNASSVIFTVEGSSKYRGIGSITVTYEDNTSVVVYTDYLTSCSTATDIENYPSPITHHKYLIDGRLYIEVNGQRYSITGQKIYE